MGADTTSTHLIFFIAGTVIATAAVGVFATTVLKLSHQVEVRGDALQDTLATEIEIINDPENVLTGPTRIYVKNTGSSSLNVTLTTVLIDGEFVDYTPTFLGGATAWKPGDVVEFSVDGTEWNPTTGDHIARVITNNGVWDDLRFRI